MACFAGGPAGAVVVGAITAAGVIQIAVGAALVAEGAAVLARGNENFGKDYQKYLNSKNNGGKPKNSKGQEYPSVKDPRTGKDIPYPEGNHKVATSILGSRWITLQ